MKFNYLTPYHYRKRAALRRERLKRENKCINAASHGAPKPGFVRCDRCVEQHRRSA